MIRLSETTPSAESYDVDNRNTDGLCYRRARNMMGGGGGAPGGAPGSNQNNQGQ